MKTPKLALTIVAVLFLNGTIGIEPAYGDSIGPTWGGNCPGWYTCCYPLNPDNTTLGDTFYNPLLSASDANYWWSLYEMEVGDWDDGWGFYDWQNPDKPLARLFHAIYALENSAPNGAPSSSPLEWGFWYALTEGEEPIPDCGTDGYATAKHPRPLPFGDEWIQLHFPFFYPPYDYSVVQRAGTLIHEARHLEACSHIDDSLCPRGASCDHAWDNGCGTLPPPAVTGPGPNQYQIVWSWEFFKSAVNTTTAMKHRAVDKANDVLSGGFQVDPCFRVGPDGKAYQLPIPACERTGDQTDYGSASIVRPQEFQLQKCLTDFAVVRSEACSYPYYNGQKWRLDPVLDAQNEPLPDGRVRIVADNSGSCLRLSATPSYTTSHTLPSGIECEAVPWNTTVVMGACSGRESEFYVTPWAAEDTSPGLTDPEPSLLWRIRPFMSCRTMQGQTVMEYGDACLDANATGDHVLRVFWCHDSPRQQFSAWYWY